MKLRDFSPVLVAAAVVVPAIAQIMPVQDMVSRRNVIAEMLKHIDLEKYTRDSTIRVRRGNNPSETYDIRFLDMWSTSADGICAKYRVMKDPRAPGFYVEGIYCQRPPHPARRVVAMADILPE